MAKEVTKFAAEQHTKVSASAVQTMVKNFARYRLHNLRPSDTRTGVRLRIGHRRNKVVIFIVAKKHRAIVAATNRPRAAKTPGRTARSGRHSSIAAGSAQVSGGAGHR